MNLSSPIQSVIPSSYGPVLEVLARTESPMTGRMVAALTDGRVSQSQASSVLRELVASGVVVRTEHPPAHLYRLNRNHVASEAVRQLAHLRDELLQRMRRSLATWEIAPEAAWLFGSLARGEGSVASDVDVLILRSTSLDEGGEHIWTDQVDRFSDEVYQWSGNDCRVVEFGAEEFEAMIGRSDRLALDVVRDGVHLAGRSLPRVKKAERVSAP